MKQFKLLGCILSVIILLMACEEPPVVFTGPQPQGIRDSKRIARIYQGRFLCQSDSATVVVNETTIYKERFYEGVSAMEDLETMDDVKIEGDSIYVEGWSKAMPYEQIGDSVYINVALRDTIFHLGEHQRVRYYRGHQIISKRMDDLKWEVLVFSLDDNLNLSMGHTVLPEDLERLKEITPTKDISTEEQKQYLIAPTVLEFRLLLEEEIIFEKCDFFERRNLVTITI